MERRAPLAALAFLAVASAAIVQAAPDTSPTAPPMTPVGGTAALKSLAPSGCLVAIWVRATGTIQAAQVVSSSGAPRLDEACAKGAINQKMIPASIDNNPYDKWVILPISWNLSGVTKPARLTAPTAETPIHRLADNQLLHVDPPYYPASAIQAHQEGVCTIHVTVSAGGDVEDLKVTHSTGIDSLDVACQDAIYSAQFVPAQLDGKAVEATTDVWLAWRLPRPTKKES